MGRRRVFLDEGGYAHTFSAVLNVFSLLARCRLECEIWRIEVTQRYIARLRGKGGGVRAYVAENYFEPRLFAVGSVPNSPALKAAKVSLISCWVFITKGPKPATDSAKSAPVSTTIVVSA